jgi:predicted Zn finger-like uncharacterized protein
LLIGHQSVCVQLERGRQYFRVEATQLGASNRRELVRCGRCAQDGSHRPSAKPSRRIAERNAFDLLDKADCVTAGVTSKTDPASGAGKRS